MNNVYRNLLMSVITLCLESWLGGAFIIPVITPPTPTRVRRSPPVVWCSDFYQPNDFYRDLHSAAEKLQVEKTRASLERQNEKSFLRRKPRKLPYEVARLWVQANLGVDTKEEFEDLVANGNLRTPYIPKKPEEYYTITREWISWEHFLKGLFDDAMPSSIRPATGILD